ncbi:autotransporter domain-containing protein [Comamonas sp. CMM02]|uniref:autotransporter domain-containing protein n=1 Tax=Comamonas sp. CMM02 TaxID=2769307 RepID=UPI0017852E72|nr:autotransporter domain-containing protein [Comamonas sp. CMM02]MBD9402135.1 autotransporter domain-containing protein [Comamonas sp. CMM02]
MSTNAVRYRNIVLSATSDTFTIKDEYGEPIVYNVTITSAISITPASLPNATVAQAYSATSLSATGGTAPYTYAVTAGSLPAGMSLSSAGTLSGTPTAGGTFNFTVRATDAVSTVGSHAYTITVSAPTINITTTTISAITAGIAYSQAINASGGTAPYTYDITEGSLPTGLSLAANGTLSGTPTTAGSYSFTVTATDSSTGVGPYSRSYSYAGTVAAGATPVVSSVTPSYGPSTGGTTVTITGTGLSGATAVTFGATAATGFMVNSSTQIIATSPAGAAGTVDIRVTTAGGTSATSVADQFTYSAAQQTQTITFVNPGAQNFGTTPTLTATSSSGLTPTFTSSTTGVCTITSSGVLTFVTAGSCTIEADQAGNTTYAQAPYVPQTFTVNAVVPGAPVVGVATAGDTQATVTFTAPASSGGAAIIAGGYTVTASPGGASVTGSSSPITVTGLTNGVPYTFTVTATNSAGTGIASAASNSVTPSTLAPLPSLSINDVSRAEGNAGTTAFIFNVTLTPVSASTVTVNYATINGTATAPSDYTATSGTLTFTPGQTTQTVTVQVNGDTTVEPDETFFVSLSNPVSAMIARAQGVGIIFNDDSASSVSAPNKTVSVAAGAEALVDVVAGATGGPFTAATVVSLIPSNAGVATIAGGVGAYSVRFVPAASFAGVAVASYTLSNATTTSAPATVTITVGARADVAQDAEVAGLATAQASAAQRFTTAQVTNFTQRLESLHGGGWGRSSFGLSLATDDTRKMARSGNGNGVADQVISGNPLRSGMRTVGLKAQRVAQAQPAATDLPDLPGATTEQARSPWAFWVNGAISYGRERTGSADDRYRFTTNGISAGVDYRVNSWITVGTGLGISTDRSRVGNKGTRSNADSTVAVAYASMRPMQGVFVDALLGYGVLSFDSQRYITATGDMATGSRDGKQLFGSIATGLEFYRTDWMWSPYARLEFSQAKLDAYTEDGPAMHALKYFDQTARSHKAVLGARAEGKVAVRWGHIMPQVRVEYARSFDEQNEAGLAYADLAAQGPAYTLRGRAMDTGRWTVGLGGRLLLRSGVELGVEYTTNIDQSSAYVGSLRLGLRVPF